MGFLRNVSKGKENVLEGKREVFLEWREQENGGGTAGNKTLGKVTILHEA